MIAARSGNGDVLPDDGGGLKQALLLGRKAIDSSRQDGLNRARDLDGRQWLHEAIRPLMALQDLGFHEGPHAFLEEAGVALGLRRSGGP